MKIEGAVGETSARLYDRAVIQLKQQYNSNWKQQTAVASMDTQGIDAVMSFTSVREWIGAKQTLERVAGMASVVVSRLTPREASVTLNYQGDAQRLAVALERSGLMLAQAGNSYQPIYRIMRSTPRVHQQMQPYRQAPQVHMPAKSAPYGNSPYNRSYYQ
jgi:hypothetical protein